MCSSLYKESLNQRKYNQDFQLTNPLVTSTISCCLFIPTTENEIGNNTEHNGEGNGTPLQYSCLENPMDGGAWQAAVHRVVKSRARWRDFTFTFYFHALEKEMATHSSVLARRIPGTGEPSRLPSMGSHRVGHD